MTTIGIIGGGQLGRMLALAGYPLGLRFLFLDPSPKSPAMHMAPGIINEYTDNASLDELAEKCDVMTYEFENVPVESVHRLLRTKPVFPPPLSLEAAQDRLVEKECFNSLNIPTPAYVNVMNRSELDSAIERIGIPAVLKTRRLGYDGKGQVVIHQSEDIEHAWELLQGVPLILEGFVVFDREVSILAIRSTNGEVAFYPLVQNSHREGILRLSIAPAPDNTLDLQKLAQSYATRLLEHLNYVGVLAIEFFQVGEQLLANEMAPRVHNSGHWTIEGAITSQFANHLRAILGWPLGQTDVLQPTAMINVIGTIPDPATILDIPDVHLHLYGKSPRPGRKVGHITVRAPDMAILDSRISLLKRYMSSA
jgi:5-(carboxyamino)imidazole ribonucleotide synthase